MAAITNYLASRTPLRIRSSPAGLPRIFIVLAGVFTVVAAVAGAETGQPAVVGVLALALLGAEGLAVRRPTSAGVVSLSFVPIAAAALLLGWQWAVLLAVGGVLLGDGLLRRRSWRQLLEQSALVALMAGAGGWVLAAQAGALGSAAAWATHAVMFFWLVVFGAWSLWDFRCEGGWTGRCTQGMLAVLFILAVWAAPLWLSLLPAASFGQVLPHAMSAFLFAAAFMLIDNVATSVGRITSVGSRGLDVWRSALLPAFYQYNGQALIAAFLVGLHHWLGLPGLGLGIGLALLGFSVYRVHVQKEDLFVAGLGAFAAALDAKDSYTQGHSDRVAQSAVAVAKALGFSNRRQRSVQLAAQLHDIGKIGIPDAVLLKPGRFTPEEFAVMKDHVEKGVAILWNVPQLRPVARIVEQEHERWNGTGYPKGLQREEITLDARIIAVADVWDALTTNRPYRGAMDDDRARLVLDSLAGTELDASLVETFGDLQERGELDGTLAFAYCLSH